MLRGRGAAPFAAFAIFLVLICTLADAAGRWVAAPVGRELPDRRVGFRHPAPPFDPAPCCAHRMSRVAPKQPLNSSVGLGLRKRVARRRRGPPSLIRQLALDPADGIEEGLAGFRRKRVFQFDGLEQGGRVFGNIAHGLAQQIVADRGLLERAKVHGQ